MGFISNHAAELLHPVKPTRGLTLGLDSRGRLSLRKLWTGEDARRSTTSSEWMILRGRNGGHPSVRLAHLRCRR
jgi:hypothetical protein